MQRIRISRRFRLFGQTLLALTFSFSVATGIGAQSTQQSGATPQSTEPVSATTPVVDPSKSTEALEARIGRARALIAAHRLAPAASELELVRAATQDQSIKNITSIMLMSVYLEEGNYGRAESLLEESFQARAQKDEALGNYFALSGQAVNGARLHLARYRSFGVNTNDATLPAEVVNDVERLRSMLERMIAQAKEIAANRKAYDSLSLLEDVSGIRLSLARDSEDQSKWEVEYVAAREALASSQTQIASLGGIPPLRPSRSSANISTPSPYSTKKTPENPLEVKTPEKPAASPEQTALATPPAQQSAEESAITQAGLLNALATKRVVPQYPTMAKQSGASGLVRVHVILDETGKVVSVSRTEGPILLRAAAENAARQWSFQITPTNGRTGRISGYIDFNFTL